MTPNTIPPSRGEYLSSLINRPWARDGRHCWRLVAEVQQALFGITLPAVLDTAPRGSEGRRTTAALFAFHPERARWMPVARPADGAIALLRRSAAPEGFFIHAGVYLELDAGGVLHTDKPHGVVFDSPRELALRGWVPRYFVLRSS